MYSDGFGGVRSSISKKQVNVLFRNVKLGNIKLCDNSIKWLYSIADGKNAVSCYTDLGELEYRVFKAVEYCFKEDYQMAQVQLLDL